MSRKNKKKSCFKAANTIRLYKYDGGFVVLATALSARILKLVKWNCMYLGVQRRRSTIILWNFFVSKSSMDQFIILYCE